MNVSGGAGWVKVSWNMVQLSVKVFLSSDVFDNSWKFFPAFYPVFRGKVRVPMVFESDHCSAMIAESEDLLVTVIKENIQVCLFFFTFCVCDTTDGVPAFP